MEIILDKAKFTQFNDRDQFQIFHSDPEDTIHIQTQTDLLFTEYEHLVVDQNNKIWGVGKVDQRYLIGERENAYAAAGNI